MDIQSADDDNDPGSTTDISVCKSSNQSVRGHIEDGNLQDFLDEFCSMHMLDHVNILGLAGVCVDHQGIDGPLMLTPFMQMET
jgi:hypothetical protein